MAGLADEAVGQTINLGSGREIAINELAREVAAVVGKPDAAVTHDDPRPGDVLRLCADIHQARSLLRFEPVVALHEGLTRLRDWYLSLGRSPEMLLEQEVVRNWEREGGGFNV
jgi:UDP-glucose 4-epimerase